MGWVLVAGNREQVAPAGSVARPRIHDRAAWLARPPKHPVTVFDRGPDHIVIHHTVTPNSSLRSLAHAYALSRAIQDFHMDHNGWNDIGEQLTVSRGGHIMEGRAASLRAIRHRDHVLGAHTANHNSHTIGIENEGTYLSAEVPDMLFDRLVRLCGWLCSAYDLDPHHAIVGHRDYNATLCPGDSLYRRLPELRNRVARAMGLATREEPEPPVPSRPYPAPTGPFDHGPALGPGETG